MCFTIFYVKVQLIVFKIHLRAKGQIGACSGELKIDGDSGELKINVDLKVQIVFRVNSRRIWTFRIPIVEC